ncbi:MAG: TRAP transporter large permease [Vulcanimicrobiaceae bacterium]
MALLAALLLVLGVPMALALGLSAVAIALASQATPIQVLTIQMFDTASKFLLLAIPLFVFASKLMEAGGLAADLVRLSELLVGKIRGGLGVAVVISAMFFSGMTGAKVAEIAAIAQTTIPSLRKRHYDVNYAVAIVIAGSAAGELVPPAINMIIVAGTLNTSVTKLFVGSVFGALLLGVLTSVLVIINGTGGLIHNGRANPALSSPINDAGVLSTSSTWDAIRGGLIAAFLPLLVFGGILGGIFSPTEAAGIACLYALLVVCVIYRRVDARGIFQIAADSAVLSGALMLLVICAAAFSQMLSIEGLQFALTSAASGIGHNGWIVVLVTIILFVVMGSVLEGLPAVIIFAPVLGPVAAIAGLDPTHFGVLMVAAIGLGLCLPPVGIGFVTACAVSNTGSAAVSKRYWPFVLVLLVGVFLIGFVPAFSTFLPRYVR